jgi:hypothetical protein
MIQLILMLDRLIAGKAAPLFAGLLDGLPARGTDPIELRRYLGQTPATAGAGGRFYPVIPREVWLRALFGVGLQVRLAVAAELETVSRFQRQAAAETGARRLRLGGQGRVARLAKLLHRHRAVVPTLAAVGAGVRGRLSGEGL